MTNFEYETMKDQIINQTKTNHILHILLMMVIGIGFITYPIALLMGNHSRGSRLRNLNKTFDKAITAL